MKTLFLSLALTTGLSACGYHLLAQGDQAGIIPSNTSQIVIAPSQGDGKLALLLRQKLAQSSDIAVLRFQDGRDGIDQQTVEIRLENVGENMAASAFDASGIANQYRVTVSASLRVLQLGKTLWASGIILRSGDVFATGGTIAIEAQKERVTEALRDEWVQKALGRLRSGF